MRTMPDYKTIIENLKRENRPTNQKTKGDNKWVKA